MYSIVYMHEGVQSDGTLLCLVIRILLFISDLIVYNDIRILTMTIIYLKVR